MRASGRDPGRVRFVFVLNPVAQELLETLEPLVPEGAPSLRSQLRPLPEVLAGLFDLAGSVRLAERARASDGRTATPVSAAAVARVLEVEDEVCERVNYLRKSALAKAESAFGGLAGELSDLFSDAAEAASFLRSASVFDGTKRQRAQRLASVAAEFHSPGRDLFTRVLRTLRGELQAVREDVAHVYRGAEGDIAALESLDAALQRAVGLKSERLQRRAMDALETWLAHAFRAEVEPLASDISDDSVLAMVGRWQGSEGLLSTYRRVALALLRGFVALELSSLEALTTAVSELAVTSLEQRTGDEFEGDQAVAEADAIPADGGDVGGEGRFGDTEDA